MSDISQDNLPYQSYDQVPWFRKNWFLIVSYIVFAPAIFFILISGDVYYEKKGKLQKYGKGAKIFLIVISALISLQLISWIGKSESEESAPNNSPQVMVESAPQAGVESAPEAEQPEYRLTAKQLCSAHESNNIATEETYKGKTIEIIGTVGGVEKAAFSDEPIITLEGSEMSMCEVHASPSESFKSEVRRIRKGDRITLICVGGDSDDNPFGPRLNDCFAADKLAEAAHNTAGAAKVTNMGQSPYRLPKLIFGKNDLLVKMELNGAEEFQLRDIDSYLDAPESYWSDCVQGYANTSKQQGGYSEIDANKYGEQACKDVTNAKYSCLNEVPIDKAALCLKRNMEEELGNAD